MKKIALYVLAITSLFMASCTEEVDTSARYVFKEEIIHVAQDYYYFFSNMLTSVVLSCSWSCMNILKTKELRL